LKKLAPRKNYEETLKKTGYIPRSKATQKDYDRIGFMSGLEVHQQLLTQYKLFCRCPAGIFNRDDDFDAEIIRHMRPTLSELGEYDGTALMEFKTRKEIHYRINNRTTCTYEIDDTPPFPIDREALEIALEISLLCKLNIVGEVHITRKQYLDGSIPTGFQRTAILGVEGEIPLKNKTVKLIQLSIEEDSCREISDVRHVRVYKTDRLGMPLIETVTYPDMVNPDEVMEAADYIRFLNRSTGKVRTGPGAGREDVNVSCKGGTRVEIKGVSHNRWIPELTHNEAFRQWALLKVKDELLKRESEPQRWKIFHLEIDKEAIKSESSVLAEARERNNHFIAVNLPGFAGILSHFTQPGKIFADELSGRLKVIACLEHPNMSHTEEFEPLLSGEDWQYISARLKAGSNDAQLLFWAPEEDIETALEVIEERCRMAFEGIPPETRKALEDGTTVFERVLPGADRMYPDTDSPPIPLKNSYIEKLAENLPLDVSKQLNRLSKWNIPADTYKYILSKNLFPLIEKIAGQLKIPAKFIGTFLGHRLKNVEGRRVSNSSFDYNIIYNLFNFLKEEKLHYNLAEIMLPVIYQYPQMEFKSVLTSLNFRRRSKEEILAPIDFLLEKYREIGRGKDECREINWVMGQLRKQAVGNMDLQELKSEVTKHRENLAEGR
jgi:glutamyl-tRNA(Gln) amidotransferase subunit E